MHQISPAASGSNIFISILTSSPWVIAKIGIGMTEIMPIPRNLNITVLPAGGFRTALCFN